METFRRRKQNLIRIEEITLGLEEGEYVLVERIVGILGIPEEDIIDYAVSKKAIDSRKKEKILLVYSVDVEIKNPEDYFFKTSSMVKGKMKRHRVRLHQSYNYEIKRVEESDGRMRPLIVGSGPSGLFAGLVLARAGLRPIIVERGKTVEERIVDVKEFQKTGKLNVESNVQFGEGGAGTFSDGKLYTVIDDPRKKFIFDELVEAGAPKEIAVDAQPHIGTDKLRQVVKNIRQKIVRLGGEVRFQTRLDDIEIVDGKISQAVFADGKKIETQELVLATGHSARDTFSMIHEKKIAMQSKPFAIGVRVEHSAEMINKAQYGEFYSHHKLKTARYKLVARGEKNRPVYTFCMCPGGYVMAASSQEERVVTNGMSEYAQDGKNSNSALLVNVLPSDFGSNHPLAGIEFQEKWEKKAYEAGGKNYQAPSQLVGDFLHNKPSKKIGQILPTYGPGVSLGNLNGCLPEYILESLREALPILDRKVKGFAHPEAVLTGVETRSSSPVKILRNEKFESNIKGIYPTGEGSGHAGGIISAAIDGMRVAEAIIEKRLQTK
ncbi:MAG: hypothetical protein ACD_15C00166G0008 [uncultured bacterium]|nr:MAG: hypothetical protein ACD_15C00166G0008 [uncultured bacterium]